MKRNFSARRAAAIYVRPIMGRTLCRQHSFGDFETAAHHHQAKARECFCIYYCSLRDNAAAAKQSHVRFLAICGGSRRDGPGGGVSGAAAGAPEARTENVVRKPRSPQSPRTRARVQLSASSASNSVFLAFRKVRLHSSIFGFLSGVAHRTQEYGHLGRVSLLLFGQFLVSFSQNVYFDRFKFFSSVALVSQWIKFHFLDNQN